MQDNSDIKTPFEVLKKDVLENQHDDFADHVKTFIQKENWFTIDEISNFIKEHDDTFSNDEYHEDGEILFGVLKFFLDTALIQNHDIKTDNVYNLLNKFQDKLSWEQSCDLLMYFLDKDWDKDQNSKNPENAKKLINDLLWYLSKLKSKKVYTLEFNYVQKYFKKIMDNVPGIKTSEYLLYISDKLSNSDFPPQFCFEIVLCFGNKLLETDIKDLGWHAQFARFRLEITKIVREKYKDTSVKKVESCFVNDIVGCFEFLRDRHYNIKDEIGKLISSKLIEYLNNKDVDWKTKFSIMNYLRFQYYYECIKHHNGAKAIPYNDLLIWKSMIKAKFESPKNLLNVFAEINPRVKEYKTDDYCSKQYSKEWLYILCFVYSKAEIYQCINELENKNNDEWQRIFLWKVVTYYEENLPESKVDIVNFFKTPGEFLDNFLKDYGIIGEFDANKIEEVSYHINFRDLCLYSIDKIQALIRNTDDPNKLALLFYAITENSSILLKSPLEALDLYMELHSKIKDYLNDTDKKVYKSLANGFKTEQLTRALKETDDPKKMMLLINALNSYRFYEDIKRIFEDPKQLFDICVGKYKSKEKNIEINKNNCKCPEPLLNILQKYDEKARTGFTEYFKNENDPLTKSWLSDLVNVKQNFFETYGNVLNFLDKNKNCPQCVKNSLNRIIKKKCDSGFSEHDGLWLFGLNKSYDQQHENCDALVYSDDIEKRCKLISDLFSNSDQHGRTVISKWFIERALKYHENIWKAVLGLIIYADEHNQNISDIALWDNLQLLCEKVDQYNSYELEYNKFDDQQVHNLTLQINQILTLNWKWFTIIWTFVYLYQLYQAKKSLNNSIAERNQLQIFVDRLSQAEAARKSFGLQNNNRDPNKKTPFQYYEKHKARVKQLLDDMQKIINHPEKEKTLNENKDSEEINNNPNIISTISNNQEDKIGGI